MRLGADGPLRVPGAGLPLKDAPPGMKVALCMTFSVYRGDFQRRLPYPFRFPIQTITISKTNARCFVLGQTLLDEVRTQLRLRGPPGNRDFAGQRVNNYRGGKDTALASIISG